MLCVGTGLPSGPGHSVRRAGDPLAGGPLFEAVVSAGEPYVLVTVTGELDLSVSGELRAVLAAQVRAGARALIVDVSGLMFLDCAALTVLLDVRAMLAEHGGALGIAGPSGVAAQVLELTGASRVMLVSGTVAEAAAALHETAEPSG